MKKFFLFLLISLYVSGCSSVKQNIAENIHYEIVGVEVDVASNIENSLNNFFNGDRDKALEGEMKVNLSIVNKNSITISSKSIKYNVFINDIYIGKGNFKKSLKLEAQKEQNILLPLHVNSQVLLSNGINLFSSKTIKLKIKGTCLYSGVFGEKHIPFTIINGKIKIQ